MGYLSSVMILLLDMREVSVHPDGQYIKYKFLLFDNCCDVDRVS